MSFRPSRLVMALACVLALAACENKPPVQKLPEISFANKRPFQLDVGQLEIVPEYVSPAKRPNVEHLMPVSPENAVVRWAQDRLHPVGRSGYARVVIRDARVIEVPLKTDKGFTGMFKEEQSERYDGSLDVAIQILDERHMVVADVVARATRTKTIREGASMNERDRVLYEIAESMVTDIDTQMDGLINTYLTRWVR
ncbi:MAG TPA: hypothetical protein VK196_11440 [Magnetospirillum sp.]|nr:hypothetical protein [Magnetospirillum sp.]